MKQKGFITIFIIFGALLVFGVAYYFLIWRGGLNGGWACCAIPDKEQIMFMQSETDRAIELVSSQDDVIKFNELLAKKGKKVKFTVETVLEDGISYYLIQVYEDVDDGNGQSHTATFGWYKVDKKTGKVDKEEL